jgi:Putative Zn-dependent protease
MSMKKWFVALLCVAQIGWVQGAEAGLISEADEIQMGAEAAQQLESQYKVSDDERATAEVMRMVQKLVPYSERPHLDYSIKVLEEPSINALAIPGGYLYVFQGLLDYMPEEHLQAAVIGHEIGHVARKHSVRAIEKQMGIQLLLSIAVRNRHEALQNMFMNTVFASHSRGDERDADVKGFEYTTAAGYNPYSMAMSLNRLGAIPNQQKANFLSSHPNAIDRIERLKKKMADQGIRPMVKNEKAGKPQMADGKWEWPIMSAPNEQGYDSAYRSYAFAGKLSMLDRSGEFDPAKLRISGSSLYHGDDYLMAFSSEDAAALGISHQEYLDKMLEATKNWPRTKK